MANPFENYNFDKAEDAFKTVKSKLKNYEAHKAYVKGEDWQNGKGWAGPKFEGTSKVSTLLKAEVERSFASKGSIRSAVRRKVRGVSGRVPTWMISSRNAPSNPEAKIPSEVQTRIDEAQKILNEFWKNSRVHTTVKLFTKDFETVGDAVLRIFFVRDGETELDPIQSIEKAVKKVHLFKEEPGMGVVLLDKDTLKKAAFYRFERDGMVFIEMCYVDDEGLTVYKTLSKNNTKSFTKKVFPGSLDKYNKTTDESESEGLRLPLGEKLLIFQMTGDPLISNSMISQQKLVNKGLTMMSHNVDIDGFRSRVLLNAMPPGEFKRDETTGKEKFVADPNGLEVGAGKVQYANGLPIVEKEEGKIKTTFTTPSIFESQPIEVDTFIKTIETASDCILEEADQKHVAISGDATASGLSREEAREEFKQSLEDTKTSLDDVMSEVGECVLAVVAYLMGQNDRYADLQVTYGSILNPGPLSAESRNIAMNEGDKKYRSRESVMEQIGITDADAMKAKIKQEEGEILISETNKSDVKNQ